MGVPPAEQRWAAPGRAFGSAATPRYFDNVTATPGLGGEADLTIATAVATENP
ncbi:MAG: hypothetical protein JO283_03455 [Bradyrhizobium sp.]|nr:hypothetical protein [Bradyrhizobium sp.]